ncbi:PAS domain-containing protein [Rhodoflexus caldus]|uniref:PAS domain-containing protein n=1 Tax=Rhodoflexus caldus TaxID=2891236 RepID=UPI002029FFD7|nr:GAF domain-containing protein [Rhodoflexus caldus]
MSNSSKLYLIALAAVVLSVTGYFLGNNPQSTWDELFLIVIIVNILTLLIFTHVWFVEPIKKIANAAKKITNGDYNIQFDYTGNPDVDQISYGLNTTTSSISRAREFIGQIGEGKLDAEFQTTDKTALAKDPLAQALLAMKEQLVLIDQKERQRKWTAEGVALFAEILRANQKSEEEIARDIITNMVRYINGIQGALYILSEDYEGNSILQLSAAFALSEERLAKQQLLPGEGLVGQALLEKQHFYLDNLPAEYTRVASGLGESAPRYLLIVPLKANESAYGVIEIASMEPIEKYVIDFVLRVSENIAATVATVIANRKNVRLLEEAQAMTEQLRAQEEEMRQNMEELMATQEEMARRQAELERSREQLQKAKEELEENERQIRKVAEEQKEMIAQLDIQKKKLEANETVLKKAYDKMRQNQEDADKKRREIEEVNRQLMAQKTKIEANEIILKKSYEKMRQQQKEFKAKETELILKSTINRALINTMEGFYYVCDATKDYRASIIEGNIQQLTGYQPEQVLSNEIPLGKLIHPDYKNYVDTEVEKAINDRKSYILEYDMLIADGKTRKVWEKGFPVFDDKEELSHLIGFIIDYELAKKLKLNAA